MICKVCSLLALNFKLSFLHKKDTTPEQMLAGFILFHISASMSITSAFGALKAGFI